VSRRGFVLVPVLWVLAAGAAITAFLVVSGRADAAFSRNRIMLNRASWAREACLAILVGRWQRTTMRMDTVDLGRGAWCALRVGDANARLDLNHATPASLRLLLGSDSLADALLDWLDPDDQPRPCGAERAWYTSHGRRPPRNGPIPSLAELDDIRGFDRLDRGRLDELLTVGGDAMVDLNGAPAEVLRTVPGLGQEAIELLLGRRAAGRPVGSADELVSLLSRPARDALLADYGLFLQSARFEPGRFAIEVTGGVRGTPLVSRSLVTAVPNEASLTIVSQEVE
jgi:general secretion pathway protein K